MYLPTNVQAVLSTIHQNLEARFAFDQSALTLGAKVAIGDLLRAATWCQSEPVLLFA